MQKERRKKKKYSTEFKIMAIQDYLNGKKAYEQ